MRRYFIAKHAKENEGRPIALHGHLGEYHWSRLDDSHVALVASYSSQMHEKLLSHPSAAMLPHMGSRKKLGEHFAGREEFFAALTAAHPEITAESVASDAVDVLAAKHGAKFLPEN